jgi:osomolarity two-component system response regulator SSK1
MMGTAQLKRPSALPSTSSDELIEDLRTPLSTLSHELADSLQSAIQTLLHLSPPHLLDNAKEQYAGCAVQMPTTSLTALLTSMRSLNYLSANVQSLCEALGSDKEEGLLAKARKVEDFDIGEMVQNVADLLGGQAAQAGVDLVLFHGDVGIKHVSVNGDAEGLGFLLSHVSHKCLSALTTDPAPDLGRRQQRRHHRDWPATHPAIPFPHAQNLPSPHCG